MPSTKIMALFEKEAVRASGLKEGNTYRVADVKLGDFEGDLEGVRVSFSLVDTATGEAVGAILDDSALFIEEDFENEPICGIIDRIVSKTHLDREEVRRRLQSAFDLW